MYEDWFSVLGYPKTISYYFESFYLTKVLCPAARPGNRPGAAARHMQRRLLATRGDLAPSDSVDLHADQHMATADCSTLGDRPDR